ncbi:archease [Dehalococcoides sp. THU3]|uniref:archease n=1 Tax=Dehalococcoides TaxID=61434 RepID=UPI00062D5B09|nr:MULTISPECIES: archease [Dehalococcoides]
MFSGYKLIQHTADTGILAQGANLSDAFAFMASGLFNLITDTSTLKQDKTVSISFDADNYENLLVKWLNELIYIFDTQRLVFCRFEVAVSSAFKLTAICFGQKVTADIPLHHCVKGATYHLLKVKKITGGYKLQVLLDI